MRSSLTGSPFFRTDCVEALSSRPDRQSTTDSPSDGQTQPGKQQPTPGRTALQNLSRRCPARAKAWFDGDWAEIHSDLTHAFGQLAEWRAWFGRGHNQTAFLEYYDIPPEMARRKLAPLRARPRPPGQLRVRLTPAKNSVLYSTVRVRQDGYRVTSIPPSLTLFNTGWDYQLISGWTDALDGCPDVAAGRRDYLKEQLGLLTRNPDTYVTCKGDFRTRRPQRL